jgi:hypothetical protein
MAWVATVAFYKAVHVVEAVFSGQDLKNARHSGSHDERSRTLGRSQFHLVAKPYEHLLNVSRVARYMHGGHSDFLAYIPRERVLGNLLGKHLRAVECECAKFLSEDGKKSLRRYERFGS